MTPEPRHLPIVPSYGAAALGDLSSSLLASLDPEAPSAQNVLGLPPARRACLLIVDGLGWELLRDHPAAAPFLSELARNSRPRSEEHTSELQSHVNLVCRLLLEKKNKTNNCNSSSPFCMTRLDP